MQALKKAERAKQNHLPDEEPGKPSEAYDQVLELAPQDSLAASPLTLSPLDMPPADPPAAEEAPRRARNAAPPPPPRPRPKRRATPYLSARAMRLGALGGALAIVAGLFGYLYWNAMYGAGSSRNLPPVPMPGQNLPPPVAPSLAAPVVEGVPLAAPVPAGPPPAAPVSAAALPPASAPAPVAGMPPDSRGQMPPDAYMQQAPQAAGPAATTAPRAHAPASGSVVVEPDNSTIRVARATQAEQIDPGLQSGFAAFQRGDMAGARQHYQSVLQRDASNRDALLGMAAIAVHDRQPDQAAAIYRRLLEIDPNDSDAAAGLAGVRTGDVRVGDMRVGDASQSESRLRHALERDPESASILFALGNLYAREQRWSEAQQHYFRAYTAAPSNADYAFNLAVGLDRLNQGKLALNYYQRALALTGSGPANFDRAAASQRVRDLGGQ